MSSLEICASISLQQICVVDGAGDEEAAAAAAAEEEEEEEDGDDGDYEGFGSWSWIDGEEKGFNSWNKLEKLLIVNTARECLCVLCKVCAFAESSHRVAICCVSLSQKCFLSSQPNFCACV
jgi:hypothetical protein